MPRLTDKRVAALAVKAKRYTFSDPELAGHYIRVLPSGAKTFFCGARDASGKLTFKTIGRSSLFTLDEARAVARDTLKRLKQTTEPGSFKDVAEAWLKRHVQANGLRSEPEIRRCLDRYVFPLWARKEFTDIKRSDIAGLLDTIQDQRGAAQADSVLAIVRGVSHWYALRNDDYATPFTRGMRRTDPKKRSRARILNDDEIRLMWAEADAHGSFGALLKLLLLTGQRLKKTVSLKWSDISLDGVWTIPSDGDGREKGTGGELQLPELALKVIRQQPRLGDTPFVFAGRGDTHLSGYSQRKVRFDQRVPIPPWVLHDLRRTARSLMSRAGVRPDIAERAIGHTQQGVMAIYDRHSYVQEKGAALRSLADLIETILMPPADKVVAIRR